jgi:UDP-GlcNAc:undecaprenyl-phosphate GlcNAc-1-phosphate transferase
MLDTAFAIVRRAGRRGNPAKADKDHLHHRLMRLGHGQTRSVLILWVWTALLSALVLYPTYTNKGNGVIPIAVAALGIALYTLFAPSGRRGGADKNGQGHPSRRAAGLNLTATAGNQLPANGKTTNGSVRPGARPRSGE